MKRRSRTIIAGARRALVLASLTSLLLAGCSEEPDPVRNTNIGNHQPQDAGTDAADIHVEDGDTEDGDVGGDTDSDADSNADADTDTDVDENEVDAGEDDAGGDGDDGPCAPYVDLGLVDAGETIVTLTISELNEEWATDCDDGVIEHTALIAVELPPFAFLSIDADVEIATELRFGSCEQSSAFRFCDAEAGLHMPTTLGSPTAFVLLELLEVPADDEVDVTFTVEIPEDCEVENSSECVDSQTVRTCRTNMASWDQPVWNVESCTFGCDNNACLGDRCESAQVITPGEPLIFDNRGLTDQYRDQDEATCIFDDTGSFDTLTPGLEMVLLLEALAVGDEVSVSVDFEGLGYWGLGIIDIHDDIVVQIKESCSGAATCLAATNDLSEPLNFQVQSDGDHYVFIDGIRSTLVGSFEVLVNVD